MTPGDKLRAAQKLSASRRSQELHGNALSARSDDAPPVTPRMIAEMANKARRHATAPELIEHSNLADSEFGANAPPDENESGDLLIQFKHAVVTLCQTLTARGEWEIADALFVDSAKVIDQCTIALARLADSDRSPTRKSDQAHAAVISETITGKDTRPSV